MQQNQPVAVYVGEELARYGFGAGHPFGPDRLWAFWQQAQRQALDRRVTVCAPVDTHRSVLEQFHTAAYVDRVIAQSATGQGYLDCGDTPAFQGVYEAAGSVVGSVVDGVGQLMDGRFRRVFVPIAGLHHARRDSAAGFCVFNDCGIAIALLRRQFGLSRIAYVDIDAHHGDGVFYAFESDPDLVFADIHQDGHTLYPGTGHADETGRGAAQGTKLNIPMPPGANDAAFFRAWDSVEAFVREARPGFILFQCGADSIAGDPITQLRYSPAAHCHAAGRLCELADECCDGRLLVLGGGGYNRDNLALAWTGVVRVLVESCAGSGG